MRKVSSLIPRVMKSSSGDFLATSTMTSLGHPVMTMPSSTLRSPAPTASTADADEDPEGMQEDNSDDLALDQEKGDGSSSGDEVGSP
jgi:hypothetical protein